MRNENVAQPATDGQQDACVLPPRDEQSGRAGPTVQAPVIPDTLNENYAQLARSESLKFLDFIFENITGGFVEFRYFGSGPKPKVIDKSTYLPLPIDHAAVTKEVLTRIGERMIAVGPGPRCRIPGKGEGKDQDVLQVNCIWADLDYKSAPGGAIEVIRRVKDFPLRPSVVVDSGYGRHVYFVFHFPFRDSLLLEWSQLIHGLRDTLDGDPITNISRVLRLPGTLNIKERNPVPCRICEEDSSWVRYSINEVKEAIEKAPAPKKAGVAQPARKGSQLTGSPIDPEKVHDLISVLRNTYGVPSNVVDSIITGERVIRTGPSAGRDDDESARDFWIMCTLMERGVGEEDIKAIFRAHPSGCGSKWARRQHGESYLELTLKKALDRYNEKTRELMQGSMHGVDAGDEAMTIAADVPQGYLHAADDSLWHWKPDRNPEREPKLIKVCDAYLKIAEVHENVDTNQISLVIEYKYRGVVRRTIIPRSQMSDAGKLIAVLAGEGAPISSNNSKAVLAYLTAYENAFSERISEKKTTGRFGRGRSDGPFFLPGLQSDIEFAPTGPGDLTLYRAFASRQGTLKSWIDLVGAVNGEQMIIPQAAILAAFIPPLQRKLQIPNFVLDLYGSSSRGKSTTLKLAASVWGQPLDPESVVHQWVNTRVAVEQIAYMCSELPVFLDDAQHASDELKRGVIYMIANGRGKARGARMGGIRETATWHTIALSTSESPLHESSPHEGARGRLLPLGGFVGPFPPNYGTFVQSLERAVAQSHGHAGEVFIKHLNGWTGADWSRWRQRYIAIRSELTRQSSSDIVGRVSGYIAAIQVVGEIVCPLLGLPFKPFDVSRWLMTHLEEHQDDQNQVGQALRALADFYISNKISFDHPDDNQAEILNVRQLYGSCHKFRFVGFLRNVFDDICAKRKWNSTAILIKLNSENALITTEPKRHDKKVTVKGNSIRMICVKWEKLLPDDRPSGGARPEWLTRHDD